MRLFLFFVTRDEREQLTSDLQLIENSIQDREREIKRNHQLNETTAE